MAGPRIVFVLAALFASGRFFALEGATLLRARGESCIIVAVKGIYPVLEERYETSLLDL